MIILVPGVCWSQLLNCSTDVARTPLGADLMRGIARIVSRVICTCGTPLVFFLVCVSRDLVSLGKLALRVLPAVTGLAVDRWLQTALITRRASSVLPKSNTGEGVIGPTLLP